MRFTYTGDAEQIYPQYRDGDGSTLVARPGETYDIEQADGHTAPGENGEPVAIELPMPPDDRWKSAKASKAQTSTSETETSR